MSSVHERAKMFFDSWNENERRAMLVVKAYEDVRQKQQVGYTAFRQLTDNIKEEPLFKQFVTVSNWLTEQGYAATWKEVHWVGYFEHVFARLHPKIPQPGQCKNLNLLQSYRHSKPTYEAGDIDFNFVYERYARVLDREVLTDSRILYLLGLSGVTKCWKNKR